jgi:ABC-type transport system substrate-binding protein
LTDFGIDGQIALREKAAYGKDYRTGNFSMTMWVWGVSGQSRHPYKFFSTAFSPGREKIGNFDASAMDVPYPVGDPRGDIETVDVTAKIEELGNESASEQQSLVEELAWIYNQTLPRLPLMTGVQRAWLTNDDWDIPSKSSEWMRNNGVRMTLSNGKVQRKSESSDERFTLPTRRANPNDIQWNPYFAQASARMPGRLMFELLVGSGNMPRGVDVDVPANTPILADSVETSDGTLRITLKDNRTWTDGDAVTAEDAATQFRLDQHLGMSTGNVWDELTVPDQYTLEFDIGQRNPELVASVLAPTAIHAKRDSKHGEWLTQFEEASTEEERSSIQETVVATTLDEPESYGLWKLESVSSNRVLMTKHSNHPAASEVDYKIEIPAISSNQTRWQSLKEDRIDGLYSSSAPKSIEQQFPDHAVRLAYSRAKGDAIVFNHGRAPFDDRRVRKAIAFLINRKTNANNAKDFVTTVRWPTGLSNTVSEQHLGDAIDQYQQYGYEQSYEEEAARLLKAAGYTRR